MSTASPHGWRVYLSPCRLENSLSQTQLTVCTATTQQDIELALECDKTFRYFSWSKRKWQHCANAYLISINTLQPVMDSTTLFHKKMKSKRYLGLWICIFQLFSESIPQGIFLRILLALRWMYRVYPQGNMVCTEVPYFLLKGKERFCF